MLFEKHPFLTEWIQLPWHVCWNLVRNSGSKNIYVWKTTSPAYCLKNFVIPLPFAWVSHYSWLEIGFLVEINWKVFCGNCDPFDQQVVPNLFAYIWKVTLWVTFMFTKYERATILSIWRCMDWTDGCIQVKVRNRRFCCLQFQNIYITFAF